jgi:hypothetical protein
VPRVASVHHGHAVGINVVIDQRDKTVSSLSNERSGATESSDAGSSATRSGAMKSVEAENGDVEGGRIAS